MAQAMSSLIGTSWSWAGAPSPDCKDCTFLISEHPSRDAVHSVSIALPSPLIFPGLLADQVKKGLAQFVLYSQAGFPSSLFVAMAFPALPVPFPGAHTASLPSVPACSMPHSPFSRTEEPSVLPHCALVSWELLQLTQVTQPRADVSSQASSGNQIIIPEGRST